MNQLSVICPLQSHPTPASILSLGPTLNDAIESISYITLPITINFKQQKFTSKANSYIQNLTALQLSYTSLLKIFENMKLILEIASSRTANWQRFCLQNSSTIQYLIDLALLMGIDSNGSGSDSSSLSGSSSISVAFTPAIVPTILQCIVFTIGNINNSSKTDSVAQTHHINVEKTSPIVANTVPVQKVSRIINPQFN